MIHAVGWPGPETRHAYYVDSLDPHTGTFSSGRLDLGRAVHLREIAIDPAIRQGYVATVTIRDLLTRGIIRSTDPSDLDAWVDSQGSIPAKRRALQQIYDAMAFLGGGRKLRDAEDVLKERYRPDHQPTLVWLAVASQYYEIFLVDSLGGVLGAVIQCSLPSPSGDNHPTKLLSKENS